MIQYKIIRLNKEDIQKHRESLKTILSVKDYIKIFSYESCVIVYEQDEKGNVVSYNIYDSADMANMINRLDNKPLKNKYSAELIRKSRRTDDRAYAKPKDSLYESLNKFFAEKKRNDDSKAKVKDYEKRITELETKLEEAHKLDNTRLAEINDLHTKYNQAQEDCKKLQITIDAYKDLITEKPKNNGFKAREIAIIALALSRKADVVPKNKKNIADLFNKLTGVSANTLSINLCSSYKDEEVKAIADQIEEAMPEFAHYLRENKFAGVKK